MKKIRITILPINIETTIRAAKLCKGEVLDYIEDGTAVVGFDNTIDVYHFGRIEKMEEMFLAQY